MPAAWRCDGELDCAGAGHGGGLHHGDRSDEEGCRPSDQCDPLTEFACERGGGGLRCVPLDLVCDGHVDCPDASDESADCVRKNLSPYSIFHHQGPFTYEVRMEGVGLQIDNSTDRLLEWDSDKG